MSGNQHSLILCKPLDREAMASKSVSDTKPSQVTMFDDDAAPSDGETQTLRSTIDLFNISSDVFVVDIPNHKQL